MARNKNIISPFDQRAKAGGVSRRDQSDETARAIAAFDAMVAARPLRPPPGRIAVRETPAAEVEARQDARRMVEFPADWDLSTLNEDDDSPC